MNRLFLIIPTFCALPFLWIGISEIFQNVREANSFVHAEGTVVRNIYIATFSDGNVSGAYLPQVEYLLPNGSRKVFTDKIGSLPPDYEIGAKIEILYDAENSSNSQIDSWKRMWLVPRVG